MSAEIIQFRPRPNPTRDQQTLEQLAIEVMNQALIGEPGMVGCEPVIWIAVPDTAPSEMNPDKEPAA